MSSFSSMILYHVKPTLKIVTNARAAKQPKTNVGDKGDCEYSIL